VCHIACWNLAGPSDMRFSSITAAAAAVAVAAEVRLCGWHGEQLHFPHMLKPDRNFDKQCQQR
jgi:hypothetical protein